MACWTRTGELIINGKLACGQEGRPTPPTPSGGSDGVVCVGVAVVATAKNWFGTYCCVR